MGFRLRLRAKIMATKTKMEDFAGGPSWCMIYGIKLPNNNIMPKSLKKKKKLVGGL